jgi:hypothetical protein
MKAIVIQQEQRAVGIRAQTLRGILFPLDVFLSHNDSSFEPSISFAFSLRF